MARVSMMLVAGGQGPVANDVTELARLAGCWQIVRGEGAGGKRVEYPYRRVACAL